MSLKDLPSTNAPNFSLRVREMLHTMLGKTGSADERLLTLREAVASGVVKPGPGGSLVPGDAIGGGTGGEAYVPDLTPPPAPYTLTATPAISHILLEVPAATYTQGHGHLRTRVYGVTRLSGDPAPVFADAVEVGQFGGTVWAFPSNPSTTWHFWAKWESVDGVLSASPVGGTNGVVATTGQDVSSLLDALAGQISTSELATSLATRIGQIPGMQADIADTAAAIAQEVIDRGAAVAAEALARANAIASEINARESADDALQQQIDIISSASSGDLSALLDAVNQERDARIADVLDAENAAAMADQALTNSLAAEVSARSLSDGVLSSNVVTLAQQSAGNAASILAENNARALADGILGAKDAAVASHAAGTSAALLTEQTIRATADGAQASQVQALAAVAGQSAAAIKAEESVRASQVTAIADRETVLAAQVGVNAAAISTAQQASATADAAQAAQTQALAAGVGQSMASIESEALARATQDASLASTTTSLAAQTAGNLAAITTLQQASSAADAAQASQSQALLASTATAAAAVQTEASVRAAADAAQADTMTALAGQVGQSAAALVIESSVSVERDAALATQTQTLAAQTANTSAAVVTVQQSQATADAALAGQVVSLAAVTQVSAATIQAEATVRATADSAQAQRTDTMAAQLGNDAAALQVEQLTRASADSALAQSVQTISAATGTNAAVIQAEQTARTDADSAQASTLAIIAARTGDNTAALQTEQIARSGADGSLAQSIQTVSAAAGTNAAVIQSEVTARTTADSAQSSVMTVIAARTGDNTAGLLTEQMARTTADSAVASAAATVQAATGQNFAAVSAEQAARTTQDTALANQVNVVGAATSDNAARLRTEEIARATADSAIASRTDTVSAASAGAVAAVSAEQTSRTTADAAQAAQVSSVLAMMGGSAAGILAEQEARATADSANAATISTVHAAVGSSVSAVKTEEQARATADSATAGRVTAIGAELQAASAAIKTEQTSRVQDDLALATSLAAMTAQVGANSSDIVNLSEVVADNAQTSATEISALRSQLTGGSTATDLNALTSGLLYQMRETSAAQDAALAQQITLLSAGAGEQFDYSNIWYYDSGVESWTTNGTGSTLSAVNGWLRLVANSGTLTDRYFISPDNLNISGSKYPQVRLRVRKVGTPTWEGTLYFITTSDAVFNGTKSMTVAEPTYDANGIGLVTFNMPAAWTGATIRQIRFDASTSISTANYFELDWVAVGRPSPGASSAQLTALQVAMMQADDALAQDVTGLEASLNTLAGDVATKASASALSALETRVTSAEGVNTSQGSSITSLQNSLATTNNTVATKADASALSSLTTRVTTAEGTISSHGTRLNSLENTVNNPTTGVAATAAALDTVETLVNNASTGVTATANKTALLESRFSNAKDIFSETWDGPDPLSRWQNYSGSGERSIVSVADSVGGKALRVGNNAGNDMAWMLHRDLIPFDPGKMYRARVIVRRTNGTGQVYVGWAGVAADGVTLVNISGLNDHSSQHNHATGAASPSASWTEYTGYTKGHGATIGTGSAGTLASPGKMHPNVRYLRALILVNFNSVAGIAEVGRLVVDDAEVKEVESGLSSAIALKADASALSALSTTVTNQGSTLTSQGSAITTLQNNLSALDAEVDTKASSSALSALDSRVTTAENSITSQGSSITSLNNSLATTNANVTAAQTTANNAATAAANAQTTANTASTNATTANNLLADIASDSKLTPVEKQSVRSEWNVVSAEKAGINTQAGTFGVTTENTTYNNAFQTLANYLNNGATWSSGVPNWISDANLSTTTNIVGATFRTNWQNLYTARTALLNRIAARAKELADAAQAAANAANTLAGTKADASALATTNTNVSNLNGTVTALSTNFNNLKAAVESPTTGLSTKASIAYVDQAEADAVSAAATASQTLVSNLNTTLTAAINTEATTRASETGDLFAKYTVKVDVAGHVSGYGLASTANNGAVVSQFGILADQFFVAPPATSSATAPTTNLYKGMVWVDTSVTPNVTRYYTGSAWSTTPQALPFVVQTTPTTINGVAVPAGAYFNDAFIQNGTITNAKIANLAVDDAKIANLSVSKLTAGSLAVGQYAQSTDYDPGSYGWRINGDGTAEFSDVVVRGTIFASQGAIGGWTIGSNYLQSTTYVLGTSGTRFNSDGTGQIGGITIYAEGLGAGSTAYDTGNGAWIGRDGKLSLKSATNSLKWDGTNLTINGGGTFSGALSAATGTFAGSLSAATGTFSGALNAATGTFSGSLTADAVNAVNTINLAGNAVTVPVGVSSSASVSIQSNEATIQTAAIDAGGQPVCVFASAAFDGGNDSSATVTVRLRRNGSQIMASYVWVNDTNRPNATLVFADTPGPGIHTYTLTAYASGAVGSIFALDRSLVLIGLKR